MALRQLANRISQSLNADELNPKERILLESFAAYGELNAAEWGIELAARRMVRDACLLLGICFLFLSPAYVGFFYVHAIPIKWVLIAFGVCGYVIMAASLIPYVTYRSGAYLSFVEINKVMRKLDPALQSVPASAERMALARGLLNCSAQVRNSFGSRPGFKLHKKILRQQSIRASRIFEDLVYLAMLGDDEELERVRSVLARAILKIGTSNWIKVGDITVETDKYERVPPARFRFMSPDRLTSIILVALTAIPAIPILISALK